MSKKSNISIGRGILKSIYKIEVNCDPETSLWDKSYLPHDQVENHDEIFDMCIKNKNGQQIDTIYNNDNNVDKKDKNESNEILYFDTTFMANDYTPILKFEDFTLNSRERIVNEDKVLRFKWTEKLEREHESKGNKQRQIYQQPHAPLRLIMTKLDDLPTLVVKKSFQEIKTN